jgi:hypothetical protein
MKVKICLMNLVPKKTLTIILLTLLIFILALLIGSLGSGKKKEISLPQGGKISQYLQAKLVDLDGDHQEELVALYHDRGEGTLYRPYFAIFKEQDGQWQSFLEQPLEGFTVLEGNPTETGQFYNQFELADITGNGLNEVLVKTRAAGSGLWLGLHLFGLDKGKIKKLTSQGPIPRGEAGIEANKIWILSPEYAVGDPNCCPSFWIKSWWQWQADDLKKVKESKGSDFETVRETK